MLGAGALGGLLGGEGVLAGRAAVLVSPFGEGCTFLLVATAVLRAFGGWRAVAALVLLMLALVFLPWGLSALVDLDSTIAVCGGVVDGTASFWPLSPGSLAQTSHCWGCDLLQGLRPLGIASLGLACRSVAGS